MAGPLVIEEVIARGVRFRIGGQLFTMHFHDKDNGKMAVGTSSNAFGIERVK